MYAKFKKLNTSAEIAYSLRRFTVKKVITIITALGIVAIIKFGMPYFIIHGKTQQSISNTWDRVFKNQFLSTCLNAAHESIMQSMYLTVEPSGTKQSLNIKKYSQVYCECITQKIEASHIFAIKYNRNRGIASVKDNGSKVISEYINSSRGIQDTGICKQEAIESLMK